MMKSSSLLSLAALALACCGLTSCFGINGGGGPTDVVNPTVSQQDELDVRWGLPKRVAKSSARRSTPSAAPSASASVAAGDANTQAAPADAAPAPAPTGAVSDEVKNKLR